MRSSVIAITFLSAGLTAASPLQSLQERVPGTVVPGWEYTGCFMPASTGRVLTDKIFYDDTMTNQKCATLCAGYGDFGLEYGRECMCGNSNRSGGRAPEVDCRMKCPGDTTQLCGGQRRSSVFALEGTSFPLQILPHQPRGCYAEPATGRLISYAVVTDNAMTVAKCAEICIGSGLFGLEYGRECFCHSPYLVDVPETAKVADSQCSMPCAGNSSEICGGPSRLNLYEYYYE